MPFKRVLRKYNNTRRTTAKKYGTTVAKANASARQIQAIVKRQLYKTLETKHSTSSASDGQEIAHNNFISRSANILQTTQGVQAPNNGATNNRIGDKITLLGVQIKGMFELNERYSDATIRIFVIRAAKGDTPTLATLWNNSSGNKMLDTINKERYSVMYSRTLKMKAPQTGVQAAGVQVVGSGWALGQPSLSRATKIFKFFIKGKSFNRSQTITYENNTDQVKFYNYHLLYYAYSNFDTSSLLGFNVARINDEIITMYYKDA